MADFAFTPHDPWADLLTPLAPASHSPNAAVRIKAKTHGFSADILLPRTQSQIRAASLPRLGFAVTEQGLRIACLTPHHYLINADHEPQVDTIHDLFGPQAEMIEQSGARACLIVSGPATLECLRRGIVIDLDPSVFPPNSFAATYAGHIPVHVTALNPSGFELSCPVSMAGSFWHWLYETAQAFGVAQG